VRSQEALDKLEDGYLSKPIDISLLTKDLQAFLEQETAKK